MTIEDAQDVTDTVDPAEQAQDDYPAGPLASPTRIRL
jgi:hypothetical protein